MQGAINRSEPLQRRCQEYLAKFEGSLVRLLTIKANLESTIELHNRYKDAVSIGQTAFHSFIQIVQE